jgi:hypothetical protein
MRSCVALEGPRPFGTEILRPHLAYPLEFTFHCDGKLLIFMLTIPNRQLPADPDDLSSPLHPGAHLTAASTQKAIEQCAFSTSSGSNPAANPPGAE